MTSQSAIPTPTPPSALTIRADDGRELLRIDTDGTVTGDLEDASEAAATFVRVVRSMLSIPTTPDPADRRCAPPAAPGSTPPSRPAPGRP